MSRLWDFGWFDLTRFAVVGAGRAGSHPGQVLRAFFQDSISQRSFCSPGGWGEFCKRHGPIRHWSHAEAFFRPVSAQELASWVTHAFEDPQFAETPTRDQQRPVWEWLEECRSQGGASYRLEIPEHVGASVDWAEMVWLTYQEAVHVSPDGAELTVGVIGYD